MRQNSGYKLLFMAATAGHTGPILSFHITRSGCNMQKLML